MKAIKLINLFILALFCQVVFSQNNDIVKSVVLRSDKSVKGVDSTNIAKALKIQFEIPENYEFKRQIIKGTKDKMSEKDDLGYVHERYAQYYKGIKIEHSDIRVHYLDGSFVSANGEYINAPNIDISVILSKENAIQKAIEYIDAKEYMWEDEVENNRLKNITNNEKSFYPNAEIVICKNSINVQDTMFHIAYKIDIFAKEPFRHDYVYVDAKTGDILNVMPIFINTHNGTADTRYSDTRTISTEHDGISYILRDNSRGGGIVTLNANNSFDYNYIMNHAADFLDNDNYWSNTEFDNVNKDNGALDAHWGTMMTYDYFKNIHGRNSYDNNNGTIYNYVHFGTNYDNAGWNPYYECMVYGDGYTSFDILTALDVAAHEIGHGVCTYSANLVYSGESGAINESLSDIWGACVENWATTNKQTWLMGEDITLSYPCLRNMQDPGSTILPSSWRQPATYGGGPYWTSPNADVHTNSGIMNHWFYILSVGKSGTNGIGNNYNVTGISISKAEKIAYRAETVYMTANTNFANARTHTINAAIDLYGNCSPEVISVTNAWHAVGVGGIFTETVNFTGIVTAPIVVTSDTTIVSCGDINVQYVKVQSNAKLTLDAAGEVNIISDFEVELGSEFEIK